MLTYDEAIQRILSGLTGLPPEEAALGDARGRILAADIAASVALPPFDNSQMDGYAVRAAEIGVPLSISGEAAAGASDVPPLAAGTARAIMTGAPIPPGADSVVPMEDADVHDGRLTVRVFERLGQYVRRAGADVQAGEPLLTAGALVRPFEIGIAAAQGRTTLPVIRRPRVALIITGDELAAPGGPLAFGQVYNSNGPMLAAQIEDAGAVVCRSLRAGDTPEALRGAFAACADADVLLTSGGVSVGGRDYVKTVFEEFGTLDFWRVAIRPGKPLAFGTWGHRLFFGLPGNPVSSSITFELFVRPALKTLAGHPQPFRPIVQARLTETASHEPGRRSYQRAVLTHFEDEWQVHSLAGQGSHQMKALAAANALLILPDHVPEIPGGSLASVVRMDA